MLVFKSRCLKNLHAACKYELLQQGKYSSNCSINQVTLSHIRQVKFVKQIVGC